MLIGLLYAARLHSYLLFHTLAEIFFIVVCLSVIVMAWSLREFLDNDFAMFLGAALCAIAGLHVAHLVDYPGLGLLSGSLDPPTQVWLAARLLLACSMIAAAFVVGRRLNMGLVGLIYAVLGFVALASVYWWQIVPATLTTNGLTSFKRIAEYVICLLFVIAGVLLWRQRARLPEGSWPLLRAALVASIVAELWFSFYHSVATWPNMLGHFFLVASAVLIFRAIVDDSLARPHAVAMHHLRDAELMHRRLEQGLMPSLPVEREGLSVFSESRPGERLLALSGDFMDVLDNGQDGVAIICGDVSGHGANAAALGAMLRASWQSLSAYGADPVGLVESLRGLIVRERRNPGTFATLCLAWLGPRESTLRVINIGHPLPLLIAGGDVSPLAVPPIPPLGTVDYPVPEPHAITLPVEWQLLFYTDGLVEGRVSQDSPERFGEKRLVHAVSRHLCDGSDSRCLGELLADVEGSCCERFSDDVTAVLISNAAASARAALTTV